MNDRHREFLKLLPWYVNGTLAAADRQALQAHLRECLICNKVWRDERRTGEMVRQLDTVPSGLEQGKRDLLRRMDARAGRQSRREWRTQPAVVCGLAATIAVAVIGLGAMLASGPETASPYTTLSTAGSDAVQRVDIVFSEAADTETLDAFLREINARLVSGPSELGRYTIEPAPGSDTALPELLEQLDHDPRIRFSGPTYIPVTGMGQGQ